MIAKLETMEQEIHSKMEELETKDLYREVYSRRENIKFTNIEELSSPSKRKRIPRKYSETFSKINWAICKQEPWRYKEYINSERRRMTVNPSRYWRDF